MVVKIILALVICTVIEVFLLFNEKFRASVAGICVLGFCFLIYKSVEYGPLNDTTLCIIFGALLYNQFMAFLKKNKTKKEEDLI